MPFVKPVAAAVEVYVTASPVTKPWFVNPVISEATFETVVTVFAVSVTVCKVSNSCEALILKIPPVVALLVFIKISLALPSVAPLGMVIAVPPLDAAILKLLASGTFCISVSYTHLRAHET